MFITIKCKKCRKTILEQADNEIKFINEHNLPYGFSTKVSTCSTNNSIFANTDSLPDWITEELDKENWSKGKIYCKYCNSSIGAFNFVSGMKCSCLNSILPAVHFNKSKVDVISQTTGTSAKDN